jgi:hypothetical protein
MEHEAVNRPARQQRAGLAWILLPLLAFLAGLAAMAWLLTRWSAAASFLGVAPSAPAPQPVQAMPMQAQPQPLVAPGQNEPARLVIDPETTRRVALLEQRVAEIDSQSRAAVGNADRAEGLLVAFAARRALDRGVPLGYIEGLLRQRFGDSQRAAVATIFTASRQPVTLQELQDGLQEIGPTLGGVEPGRNWWDALRHELGDLVTIRREGTPSTMPDERLKRATRRLEAGQVEVALAEVLRMPGRERAGDWIAKARRYVMARRALDTIETAALLDQRTQAFTQAAPALAPGPVR